ncbi:MAG: hypothetical protein AB7H81_17010 [Vicinamibacterales bacterium]
MADEMSMQEVAQRLEELAQGFQRRFDQMDARFDRVEVRLDGIDARLDSQALRLDSIDEKARLALEAHEVLRESMDRQFRAASEKADERHELLKDIVRRTSLRVRRLEARRKRR